MNTVVIDGKKTSVKSHIYGDGDRYRIENITIVNNDSDLHLLGNPHEIIIENNYGNIHINIRDNSRGHFMTTVFVENNHGNIHINSDFVNHLLIKDDDGNFHMMPLDHGGVFVKNNHNEIHLYHHFYGRVFVKKGRVKIHESHGRISIIDNQIDSINLSGTHKGIDNRYDPFDSSTGSALGLIYFISPGCSIRTTRYFAYESVKNSLFSTKKVYKPEIKASHGYSYIYTAKGSVDFSAGIKYSIPLVDPNAKFDELITPKTDYKIFSDSAGNLFMEFTDDYQGDIEYTLKTDKKIEDLAFIDPQKLQNISFPGTPELFGIPELQAQSWSDWYEFIEALQNYFTLYDESCDLDFQELESKPTKSEKIDFMIKNHCGSCRHRAFLAYLIIKSINDKTHYVVSQLHAWVESYVDNAWRYFDFGGCPVNIEGEPEDSGNQETIGKSYKGPLLKKEKLDENFDAENEFEKMIKELKSKRNYNDPH